MNKTVIRILAVMGLILVVGGWMYYDAFFLAANRLSVRYETVTDEKITAQLDNLTVVFFSDLHYNRFMNKERLEKIITTINAQNPDVVVFLGDLFDHPSSNIPSDSIQTELTGLLSTIHAPYGKFAIYGNHDLEAETSKQMIATIYQNSGFELLVNQEMHIYRNSATFLNLVALDSALLGTPDTANAFMNQVKENYTIVICHTPDEISELSNYSVDLMLAGHSHGGQIYLPVIGPLYKAPYAQQYYRGKQTVNGALLDITNGVGTTRYDARLFADPEIVVYRFQSAQ